jgi:hypothetical protein
MTLRNIVELIADNIKSLGLQALTSDSLGFNVTLHFSKLFNQFCAIFIIFTIWKVIVLWTEFCDNVPHRTLHILNAAPIIHIHWRFYIIVLIKALRSLNPVSISWGYLNCGFHFLWVLYTGSGKVRSKGKMLGWQQCLMTACLMTEKTVCWVHYMKWRYTNGIFLKQELPRLVFLKFFSLFFFFLISPHYILISQMWYMYMVMCCAYIWHTLKE